MFCRVVRFILGHRRILYGFTLVLVANLVKAPMQLLTIICAMSYGFLATEDSDPISLRMEMLSDLIHSLHRGNLQLEKIWRCTF